MNAFHPYSTYKQSGVEWIGQIPAHWQGCRTKFVARLYSGHTPSRDKPEYWLPDECTIPWFTLADVWQLRDGTRTYLGDTSEKISPLGLANSAARLLPAGTVIVSRTASVGFAGIMPRPMATTQDFVNWVCGERIRPRFLLHVFRAMRGEFSRLTMGSTHQTIYMPEVRSFSTPLPPVVEQEAIIAFLDRETARFDALIAKMRRLIELLREKRQAVISHAVTKGLDPGAPLKDSGVEWLGDIPAHWEILPARRLILGIEQGWSPLAENRQAGPDEYGIAILSAVSRGSFDEEQHKSLGPEMEPRRELLVRQGDVLMLRGSGSVKIVGDVALVGSVSGRVIFPDLMYRIQVDESPADKRYLVHFFLSTVGRHQIERDARGINIKKVNHDTIKGMQVALPPREDQSAISDHIEHVSLAMAKVTDGAEEAIARLEEHRAAVIAAAVTGKIDVREYATETVEAAE